MKVGSLVECRVGGEWYCKYTDEVVPGPDKDEITEIAGFDKDGDLIFYEYPLVTIKGTLRSYPKNCFRELLPPTEIKSLLQQKENV